MKFNTNTKTETGIKVPVRDPPVEHQVNNGDF